MIPYGRQCIDANDINAVLEVLRSDWLTQGPAIANFEKRVCEKVKSQYGVAVSNATAGLHIAYLGLGLGPGDRLWTSPNTFVASANAALYCGATVDFVDIDPKSYNISITCLEEKLKTAKSANKLPKIVTAVHFSGQSCDMKSIYELSRTYGFAIVEDASHAIGGSYRDTPVGCCRYSDAAVFSFHPVKIITTGEGGLVTTNNSELYEKMTRLRSHGITRDSDKMTEPSHGPWYYQQLDLGWNYRMTDLQAALGYSQMTRLEEFVSRRTRLARRYNDLLASLPLSTPWETSDANSSWHLYVVRLDGQKSQITHRQLFESMRGAGIGVNLHYIPVHIQPYYKRLGFKMGDFPEAEKYYSEAMSLPLYFGLSDDTQDSIAETLSSLLLA